MDLNNKKAALFILILVSLSFFILQRDHENSPNVIFIVSESTRADHIPCYGYERNTTPSICELKNDGVLFEKAISQGSYTARSLPSLLTSSSSASVGLDRWNQTLSDKALTIAETLQREGYTTVDKTSGIIRRANFDQGMEERTRTMNEVFDRDPFLLFWFINEQAHQPYDPEEKFRVWDQVNLSQEELEKVKVLADGVENPWNLSLSRRDLIDLYDEELLEADNKVGEFLRKLKNNSVYEDSLIIYTSDHGESFGRYGYYNHGAGSPYQEQVHVPLIIKFPENKYAGHRVKDLVRHVDVVPTIYDHLNIRQRTYGESLTPLIKGESFDAKALTASHDFWSLYSEKITYILKRPQENCKGEQSPGTLYNLSWNSDNMSKLRNESLREKMAEELCSRYISGKERRLVEKGGKLSENIQERLENLGYKN